MARSVWCSERGTKTRCSVAVLCAVLLITVTRTISAIASSWVRRSGSARSLSRRGEEEEVVARSSLRELLKSFPSQNALFRVLLQAIGCQPEDGTLSSFREDPRAGTSKEIRDATVIFFLELSTRSRGSMTASRVSSFLFSLSNSTRSTHSPRTPPRSLPFLSRVHRTLRQVPNLFARDPPSLDA